MTKKTFRKVRKQLILGLTSLGYDLQNDFVSPIDYIQILLQENGTIYDRINLKAGVSIFETNAKFDCQKALNIILNEHGCPIFVGINLFAKTAFACNKLEDFLKRVSQEMLDIDSLIN